MPNSQLLVNRLYALSMGNGSQSAEYLQLDSMVYERLLQTYADDETFEASIRVPAFDIAVAA